MISEAGTVLGRTVSNDGVGWQTAQRIRAEAATVQRTLGGSLAADWNRAALRRLADHIESLSMEHPLLVLLHRESSRRGNSDDYHPGTTARGFLASVGTTGHKGGSAERLLEELCLCALEDALEDRRVVEQALHARDDQEPERSRRRDELVAERDRAREEADQGAVQGSALQAKVSAQAKEIESLKAREQLLTDAKDRAERAQAKAETRAEQQKDRAARAAEKRKEAEQASQRAWAKVRELEGKPETEEES